MIFEPLYLNISYHFLYSFLIQTIIAGNKKFKIHRAFIFLREGEKNTSLYQVYIYQVYIVLLFAKDLHSS